MKGRRAKKVFAHHVEIDTKNFQVAIDGVRVPWHIERAPEVEPIEGTSISIVYLPILVDGPVVFHEAD